MSSVPVDSYKGIVLLKRRKDMSQNDILDWALNTHAHYGRSIERIFRYTTSLVVAPGPRFAYPEGEPPFDLVNEIWCRSEEDLRQAYAELESKGGPKHSIGAVSDRVSVLAREYVLK